jgi:hypothetical protein
MVERLLSVALTVEQRRGRRLTVSLIIGRVLCRAGPFDLRVEFRALRDIAILIVLRFLVL